MLRHRFRGRRGTAGRSRRRWPTCRSARPSARWCTQCWRPSTRWRRTWPPNCVTGAPSSSPAGSLPLTPDPGPGLLPVLQSRSGRWPTGISLRDDPVRDRLAELDFELPLAGGDRPVATCRCPVRPTPASRLGRLAPVLRRHLPPDDPLVDYPDRLAAPEFARLRCAATSPAAWTRCCGCPDRAIWSSTTRPTGSAIPTRAGPVRLGLPAAALAAAMMDAHYPLQALLYSVALHRFLRWRQPGYDPEQHLGGVLYLFVRGMCGPDTPMVDGRPCGVFGWRPPVGLVTDLSDLLDGRRPAGAAGRADRYAPTGRDRPSPSPPIDGGVRPTGLLRELQPGRGPRPRPTCTSRSGWPRWPMSRTSPCCWRWPWRSGRCAAGRCASTWPGGARRRRSTRPALARTGRPWLRRGAGQPAGRRGQAAAVGVRPALPGPVLAAGGAGAAPICWPGTAQPAAGGRPTRCWPPAWTGCSPTARRRASSGSPPRSPPPQWTTVLGGGPGTGKTTTVARVLALLLANRARRCGWRWPRRPARPRPGCRRRSRREARTLRRRSTGTTCPRWRRRPCTGCSAGVPGRGNRFRHDRDNRLPFDVVVVDETSMVSLTMMARLLEALRPDARLILVGDPDQLASVEAGAVLADLVAGLTSRAAATPGTARRPVRPARPAQTGRPIRPAASCCCARPGGSAARSPNWRPRSATATATRRVAVLNSGSATWSCRRRPTSGCATTWSRRPPRSVRRR